MKIENIAVNSLRPAHLNVTDLNAKDKRFSSRGLLVCSSHSLSKVVQSPNQRTMMPLTPPVTSLRAWLHLHKGFFPKITRNHLCQAKPQLRTQVWLIVTWTNPYKETNSQD